jgi:predicted DNA-binding ArsR family transcriptional regulator
MDSIYFLESEEPLSWIQQYNQFNEEYNIYRTVVITNNRMILEYLYEVMEKDGYSVYKTHTGNIRFDFEEFLRKLKRILFMTVDELQDASEEFIEKVMAEHNFMILENLNDTDANYMGKFLLRADKTGFMQKPYYIWKN